MLGGVKTSATFTPSLKPDFLRKSQCFSMFVYMQVPVCPSSC